MALQSIIYDKGSSPGSGSLKVLNQLLLPHQTVYVDITGARAAAAAIKHMVVRGAPAIALVAVLGLAVEDPFQPAPALSDASQRSSDDDFFALVESQPEPDFPRVKTTSEPKDVAIWYAYHFGFLVGSRPTAVNLQDATHKLLRVVEEAIDAGADAVGIRDAYVKAAEKMLEADVRDNEAIGAAGQEWLQKSCGLTKQSKGTVLTHCNTGSLATAGYGTALGIVRSLHAAGLLRQAYYTETRPYNQGSRLTGYELLHDGIRATLITDSMAAALFRLKAEEENIVSVIVGADRVAANGDTANKIGTYGLACLARQHGVRFLVAAPRTTIDMSTATGEKIIIEERPPPEILSVKGPRVTGYAKGEQTVDVGTTQVISTAAIGTKAWNPAFDVTPAELIDGIVTELGVVEKSGGKFDLAKLFDRPSMD